MEAVGAGAEEGPGADGVLPSSGEEDGGKQRLYPESGGEISDLGVGKWTRASQSSIGMAGRHLLSASLKVNLWEDPACACETMAREAAHLFPFLGQVLCG